MRKKFATLLLAFMLIIPCALFFTACDSVNEQKVKSIAVELVSTKYTMTDNTINIPYTGGKIELVPSDFKVTATLEDDTTKELSVKTATENGYEFTSSIPTDSVTPRGTYTIAFSHPDTLTRPTITVNVVKSTLDMSNVKWTYTDAFTYDGNEKMVLLENVPEGVAVTYKTRRSVELGDGAEGYSGTNAGTYVTTATFAHSDDYTDIAPMSLSWTINPKQIDVSKLSWNTVGPYAYTGIQVLPTLERDPSIPSCIVFTYFYTQGGVSVNPYNVGSYKVEVSVRSEDLNYEVVGSVTPQNYEIVPRELDCSNVSWEYESGKIYDFNGSAITPTLTGLPDVGCTVNYTYSDNLTGQSKLVDGKSVNVGSYKATATVTTTSGNFQLVNCNIQDFEYSIKEMTIDVSTFSWGVENTLEYNGNTQKPTMDTGNYSKHISFNYYYIAEKDAPSNIPKESDFDSIKLNPINVGKYLIYAYPVFVHDSDNYNLKDGEVYVFDHIIKSFEIVEAELPTDQIGWNVTTKPSDIENWDEANFELKENEEITVKVNAPTDILNIFDIVYEVNFIEQNSEVIINDKRNNYTIQVTLTVKDGLRNNYTSIEYKMFLYAYVHTNPFASIVVNGESVSFAEFIKSTYEHGTSISLTTKDGYTMDAGDGDVTTYSYIVDRTIYSQRISVSGIEEMYVVDFKPYMIDSITVNGKEINTSITDYETFNLMEGQTSFNINIDSKYLEKYKGKLKYVVNWGEPIEITSSTTTITDLSVKYDSNVQIVYESDEGVRIVIINIDINPYSLIKSVFYNKINIDETSDVRAVCVNNTSISLSSNDILLSLKAKVKDGYTYGFYFDEKAEEKLDLTDINSIYEKPAYIIVFDGDKKIVETRQLYIDYNLCDTTTQVTIVGNESIQTNNSSFGINIAPENSKITVSSKFNNNDTLTLSDGVNTADYELNITYNGVTYKYSKKINVVKTAPLSDYLKEDGEEESFTGTINGETINNGYIYGNNLNISMYDVSQFEDIDLNSIIIGNIKDGYSVKTIEKVVANEKLYLKVSLEESSTENIIVIYLFVMISGDYNNDVDFAVYNDNDEKIDIVDQDGTKTITFNFSQGLKIELSNPYAKIVILDENGDVAYSGHSMNYCEIYNAGTYTLTVTSTDRTTTSETYTIIAKWNDGGEGGEGDPSGPVSPDIDIPETIKIGSTTFDTSESDQYYKLGKDQVEIVVKVDEEYLSGDVELYYGFDDGTTYLINSTSTTINVYNYTFSGAVMYIGYMNYGYFERLSEGIEIIVWSEVKQINYTMLDLSDGTVSTTHEVFRGFNAGIKENVECRQKLITNVTVDFEAGYTDYSYKVTEKDYTTAFDYTTISLDSAKRNYWIIMYDNLSKEIGRVGSNFNYNIEYNHGNISGSDNIVAETRTMTSFEVAFGSSTIGINVTHSSKVKKSTDSEYVNSVSLVDGINNIDWKMTVTHNSVTYTYTKSIIVFIEPIDWTVADSIWRDGKLKYNGESFKIYSDFDANLLKDGEYRLYNPNEIKDLELDKFELDIPEMDTQDVTVKSKEFVFIGGFKYIKFAISYTLEGTSTTEHLYIRLSEYGKFDNNVEFRAEKESKNGTEYLDITSSTTQISIACCTESLFVETDNEFAMCVLTDTNGEPLYSEEGFLLDYRFKVSGTYYLDIIPTNGTTPRRITINVTGEYVPDVKVVLETAGDGDNLTLICDIESFDDLTMGEGSNFSFRIKGEGYVLEAYLGADHNLKITTEGEGDDLERYVNLTAFSSALVSYLYMADGTKITTYPAKLEVMTDSNGDYIVAYIEEQPGYALPIYIYLYDKAPALQMTIEGTTTDIELLCDILDIESLETSDDSNVGILFDDNAGTIFYAYLGDLESSGVKVTTGADGNQYISVSSLRSGLMVFTLTGESELTAPCELPIYTDAESGTTTVSFMGVIMEYMQIAQIVLIFDDMPDMSE